MSTITLEELLRLWSLEKITVEMVIGQLLQNLVEQQKQIQMLKDYIHQSAWKEGVKQGHEGPLYKKGKK